MNPFIILYHDGIVVGVENSRGLIGYSPKLMIGDMWKIGAEDKEGYPYEVMITVVNRREDRA